MATSRLSRGVTYAPVALIVVLQLVLSLVVPSVRAGTHAMAGGSTGPGPISSADGSLYPDARSSTGAPGAAGKQSATPGPRTAGRDQPAIGSKTPGARGRPGNVAHGDVSHCVGGREFDPKLDYFAPPCAPGLPGQPFPNNGGATGPGVTASRIVITDYVPDYGAAIDRVEEQQGLYESYDAAKQVDAAFETFINWHYVLYGRKVHIETYQGAPCDPGVTSCLIPDIDAMVAKYHPYSSLFRSVCSACFAEFARLKVVAFGGFALSDAFYRALAPYDYSAHVSGSGVALAFADWWCSQLTSRSAGRRVAFAGAENPLQNFNGQPRVLGVIAEKDPDTEASVRRVLYPALKAKCGEQVTHEYFYTPDISTAAQQANAAMASLDTADNPATTVLCLCVSIAAAVFFNGMEQHNYWPENIISADQFMDWEAAAQDLGATAGKPKLACASPATGCEYDDAIGLSEVDNPVPQSSTPGMRVYLAGGGTGQPVSADAMDDFWNNFNMIASLIENTGPALTAARMRAAAPSMGFRGGGTTGHALRGFGETDACWVQDMRVVYFDRHRTSPYNGQPGTYVQVEGRRFRLDEFPVLPQPPIPAPAKRT